MKIAEQKHEKNKFGQYFTPDSVAEFMIEMADFTTISSALEPSCGEGVFLKKLTTRGVKNIVAYEIDESLANDFTGVRYSSFVTAQIEERFDLIIGNPPYIRWKNLEPNLKEELHTSLIWNTYFNSLCDYLYIFILKSIELLNENGQLIFICPEYWMNTTHSISLRNYMVSKGCFEQIYHFNETPIFEKVTISTVIFKFTKGGTIDKKISVAKFNANQKLTIETLTKLKSKTDFNDVEYLEIPQFKLNERWVLQTEEVKDKLRILERNCVPENSNTLLAIFNDVNLNYTTIGDVCTIGNGLVSGLDKAFQVNGHELNVNELNATINVFKAKDLNPYITNNVTKYIYIKEELTEEGFSTKYPNFYTHFQKYRTELENRYQYNRKIN
ncbi:MAG: N-6 DNA methylase, partial [Bacteroidia bacterium]